MTKKIRIFVSAYACEPNRGSESGVGWNWILQMSKYFELWVLTRKNNREPIEAFFAENNICCNIHFIYYDVPRWACFWKNGLSGVRTYYSLWQKLSNPIVETTMKRENIKIFHLLTFGNALWSISSYGQKNFFIWGPVGGVDSIPYEFSKHYNIKWRFIEWFRRVVVKTLPLNKTFQRQCRNANLILCKAESLYSAIDEKYKEKALIFTDVAVEPRNAEKYKPSLSDNDKLRLVAVGKLDAWRGFDLLIEAVAIVVNTCKKIHLDIIGKGSDQKRLLSLIEKLNLENFVSMIGHVTMDDYFQKMIDCDIVVNPCLKEGAVTTAFDSMSLGKPLICIDTGGYTKHFDNNCAIIIQKNNRNQVVNDLAQAILKLENSDLRKKLGEESRKRGFLYTWDAKGVSIYNMIMERLPENLRRQDDFLSV